MSDSQEPIAFNADSRFQHVKLIGSGAAGDVYVAYDAVLARRVAIKGYRRFTQPDADLEKALRLCAGLNHPGIAQVVDVIRSPGSLKLVQTYCEAGSLAAALSHDPPTEQQAAELFLKICESVSYVHNRGVLHRDLKLGNILLSEQGEPVLIDFDHCCELNTVDNRPLLGTPAYMAPELINQSSPPSVASEVYALGVILFELLTGRLSSDSTSVGQLLSKDASLFDLNDSKLARRKDWNAIIHKALADNPSRRYGSVKAFAGDVGNLLELRPLSARHIGRVEKLVRWGKRNQRTAILVAIASCILFTGFFTSALAWTRAAAMRTRAENSQVDLQSQINATEKAKAKLEILVKQVRAELESTQLAETRQRQMTASAKLAESELQSAATKSAELSAELQEAVLQVSQSKQAVDTLGEQRSDAVAAQNAMQTRQEDYNYANIIKDAHKAAEEKRWDDSLGLLNSTDPRYRSIEYNMLLDAISNKRLELQFIPLGLRRTKLLALSPVERRGTLGFRDDVQLRRLDFKFELQWYEDLTDLLLKLIDPETGTVFFPLQLNYRPSGILAVSKHGDIFLTGKSKVAGTQVEIVVATFVPGRFRANSETLNDTEWEVLTKQFLPRGTKSSSVPRTAAPAAAKPNRQWLLLEEETLNQITSAAWDGVGQPLRNLGQVKAIVTSLPNHSIEVGSYCRSLAVSNSGLFVFADQTKKLSVIDLKDPSAELAWTNNFPGIVNITFDSNGICYLDQGNYGPNPLFQSEVKRIAPGSQLKRQKSQVLIDDIKPSVSTSIPVWFDPNNLYVTKGLTINRYPLPISQQSKKSEWFRLDAPDFYSRSTLLLSDRRILMTISKRLEGENVEKKTYGYATLLFDLDLQGFHVLDRVIDACTVTPDGKMMLFADDDGFLKRFQLQQSSEYYRLVIKGSNVDAHHLEVSQEGIRSTYNKYGWPVFDVNGHRWEPKQQPLLKLSELSEILPPDLNFSAARINCASTGSWVYTKYGITADNVTIRYHDQPAGAGVCETSIDIPFAKNVPEDMTQIGVTWDDPWAMTLNPFDPQVSGKYPERELISTMSATASYKVDKLDFVFWKGLTTEDGQTLSEVPNDNFVMTGQRTFTCENGTYSIESFADDGIRVWIAEELVIDNWQEQRATHRTQERQLGEGKHIVRFEYFEATLLSRLFVDVRRVK